MIKYTFLDGRVFVDDSNYFRITEKARTPIKLSVVLFVRRSAKATPDPRQQLTRENNMKVASNSLLSSL